MQLNASFALQQDGKSAVGLLCVLHRLSSATFAWKSFVKPLTRGLGPFSFMREQDPYSSRVGV